MPMVNLKLSAKGLRNLQTVDAEGTFRFVVGSETYECPLFVATFLSPKITQLCLLDKTTNEFVIDTKDPNHLFSQILSLGQGCEIVVDKSVVPLIVSFCREVGNQELLEILSREDEDPDQNVGICISRLCSFTGAGTSTGNDVSEFRDISYLASHFHELSMADFVRLSIEPAESILSDASLKVDSEDQLFEFISSRFCESSSFIVLLEYVRFEYLSLASIERFVNIISEDVYEFLNVSIWRQICVRLCHRVWATDLRSRFGPRAVCGSHDDANDADNLNGIIAFLTRQCGGNVHDHGVVNITSLTNLGAGLHPKNAADLAVDNKFSSMFSSVTTPGQWLCYGFRTGTLVLTGYAIRSQYDLGPGYAHLKTWVIETSMTGSEWSIVDSRTNNADLNAKNVTVRFDLDESRHERCRFVRLRQTGLNHGRTHSLALSSFEVFGDFIE
jgi:hypothetical protein